MERIGTGKHLISAASDKMNMIFKQGVTVEEEGLSPNGADNILNGSQINRHLKKANITYFINHLKRMVL